MAPGRDWEREFNDGRLDFLGAPDEQLRHAVIASLIQSFGPGEIWDLGAGPGHLLAWLRPAFASKYVAVDLSPTALARVPASPIPVETVATPIEAFRPARRPIGSIVCSEVLYELARPGEELQRIVAATGGSGAVKAVIVSIPEGRPDRPNWTKGGAIVDAAIAGLGWPQLERVVLSSGARGVSWAITVYRPVG